MFTSKRRFRTTARSLPVINIAPLIDVVFILLIFFLVAGTLVHDRGLAVERPRASVSQPLEPQALRISITATGVIYVSNQPLDMAGLQRKLQDYTRGGTQRGVVLIADQNATTGRLVEIMDMVKEHGVRDIAVATRRE